MSGLGGWLRVVLITLMCVAAGARPAAARCDRDDARLARGSLRGHASSDRREQAGTGQRDRDDDPADDTPGVPARRELALASTRHTIDALAFERRDPDAAARARALARGPPSDRIDA